MVVACKRILGELGKSSGHVPLESIPTSNNRLCKLDSKVRSGMPQGTLFHTIHDVRQIKNVSR